MEKVEIHLTSKITQEDETATFEKTMPGEFNEKDGIMRLSYLEDGQIPIKIMIKNNEMIMRRGVDSRNHSLMRFTPGEKEDCHYLVEGRQMDLTSVTNLLKVTKNGDEHKVSVEYDLFSGLYLIGNYAVTLIFA
ncbi:DUF1934 domain-containing protein [Lactobacillus intestinalis]|uniref:DUF1934 domain-containing protein n=1 Tax=Lactobacillus intestinalis DSM 6629 TaxID=1423761 RepID=A0ABR5PSZ0_9LACO|nr:DUF1934 domain-containing protein [Lactobacillus intestinalis]KRM34148.1 hypothetical protein FC44_GL000367 [Lactobacillus intestinalis DSM 6629]UTW40524.1 DUF1934 domain-containing protein [Lactobacillus intestinalis]